ncbi:MAG: translational GTPase TypA [Patescibacteria group bacterium]
MDIAHIRNIAIIAHVDHGKTTLVDGMLKQAHVFAEHQAEMQQTTILDSNDLERERGVTILAKNTVVHWNGYKLNILDTPGHADFSGEVERVLNMADGCILLVDAAEGVLSQTRYVLSLALKNGLQPIVLINKVDRKDQRADEVIEEVNDLFLDLAITDDQLRFPILYGIGRNGIVGKVIESNPEHSLRITDSTDLTPLFQTIVDTIPAPNVQPEGPFQMQITSLDFDNYKGRYVIGKIQRGQVKKGEQLQIMRGDDPLTMARVEYLFTFFGLNKVEVDSASAGDIIALTGFPETKIGDTLCDPTAPEGLRKLDITEPTVQIQFSVSDSPFVGKDGKFTTSRQIGARLTKELETNVGLRISPGATADIFIVAGRGELHLSILIETMRREGYEFSVSRPEVVFKEVDGVTMEPWEKVTIEVMEEFIGFVTTSMGQRGGELINMVTGKNGVKFEFKITTRNLIGYRNDILTATSGSALIHSMPLGYEPKGPDTPWMRNGVIVSSDTGTAITYSLSNIQERGDTFVEPGEEVYGGMIVGKNTRPQDMVMNATRGKKATNVRSNADVLVRIAPAVKLSLEQCLNFIGPDELLEVTPHHLRLRKRDLQKAVSR